MPSNLFRELLDSMDRALVALGSAVPEPSAVPFKDSYVYRHVEKLPEQAILQKLVRLPSGLRATQLLLNAGFFQEQAALQRLVDEIGEDVIFLSIPILYGGVQPIHEEYLEYFFAEEFDLATGLSTSQDRPMVRRKKIRAYIAQSPIGGADPSSHIEAARIVNKTYSGFVHAASPQIMEMYGGNPPRFHTNGMLGTEREPEHRRDIANYYFRSITAFTVAARALRHQPQFNILFALGQKYGEAMGLGEGRRVG